MITCISCRVFCLVSPKIHHYISPCRCPCGVVGYVSTLLRCGNRDDFRPVEGDEARSVPCEPACFFFLHLLLTASIHRCIPAAETHPFRTSLSLILPIFAARVGGEEIAVTQSTPRGCLSWAGRVRLLLDFQCLGGLRLTTVPSLHLAIAWPCALSLIARGYDVVLAFVGPAGISEIVAAARLTRKTWPVKSTFATTYDTMRLPPPSPPPSSV